MSVGHVFAGLFLAAGAVGAAYVGGQALIESRAPARVVTVKGLAEREVEADIAFWRIPFRGQGEAPDAAIADATRARDAVVAFARGGGIGETDLTEEPFVLKVERIYIDNGRTERLRYSAIGAIRLRTTDVAAVETLSGRTLALLESGVLIGESDFAEAPRARYGFTRLNEIKPAMIADATRSARAAADQFAADSGARVGAIVTANQGVVQILARDGEYPEPTERWKLIRVVSTVDYQLAD